MPNGFTRGDPFGFARQYWQAGGDTSVAWDTRGNAYLSCQLFNRGTVASANPDQSSGFVIFRSTQNDGASLNFPGRYTTVFDDTAGSGAVLEDKALMTVDNNVAQPLPRPHLRHLDRIRRRRLGLHLRGPLRRLRRDVQHPHARQQGQPGLHEHVRRRDPERQLQREPVLRSVRRARRQPVRRLQQLQQPAHRVATRTTTRCCWRSRPTAARASRPR